jgi:hypothetical protein
MKLRVVGLTKICLHETYSEVHIGKHLPDNFPIQNGLKQDALLSLLFNSALENIIRKVQENQMGHISCWSMLTMSIYWVIT